MAEQKVKVKAAHQIVHDGQTLLPGQEFMASEALAAELRAANAIEEPPEEKPLVELQAQHSDDEDDGLKAK